jgi:microcystin-dependent protein
MAITKVTNRVLDVNSVSTAQLSADVQQLLVPAGTIALFPSTIAPAGWLKCDGTGSLSRSLYERLWVFANSSNNIVTEAVWLAGRIGSFSTGNTTSTFRIPDLRGEFVRAWDDGRSVDTSRVIGSAQSSANLSHDHSGSTANSGGGHSHFSFGGAGINGGRYSFGETGIAANNIQYVASIDGRGSFVQTAGAHGHDLTITSEGGTEARPRNIALLYCIKF